MMIPQVPNHSGHPQSGEGYQPCDPGPAIGKLLSCSTTMGAPPSPWPWEKNVVPDCTFVGTEGIARATAAGLRVMRFIDAPYVLEMPLEIDSDPNASINSWTFMDGYYRPLFDTTHKYFGAAAELAHAKFWAPKLIEQMEAMPPLRVWGANQTYVALTKDSVEVQQLGRRDTVKPSDIKVSFEAGDLVLRAEAFYEARYIGGETPNAMILMLLLKVLGAK